MRKFIWLFIIATALPIMAGIGDAKAETPPDSEMVYRANLGRAEDIELLLSQGGNVNAVDNNGIGLLFLAAGRKDSEGINVVHSLLTNGLSINDRDNRNRTALFYAAKGGNAEIVQYLLDNGVDPYLTDTAGDVARNYAYRAGNLDIVELMDDFARQKVEEVNSAYEKINRELQERYKQLEKQQKKAMQTVAKKSNPPKPAPKPAVTPKALAKPVPSNTKLDAFPDATNVKPDNTAPSISTTKTPEPKGPTPEQVYAEEIVDSVSETIKKVRKKAYLDSKIAEEARMTAKQEKLLEIEKAKELLRIQEEEERLADERKAKAIRDKRQAKENAAADLRRKLHDAQMEAYMRAEIESEAAAIKIQQDKEAMADTATRKARLAETQRRNDERDEVFSQLSYHNCMFQYWYYCYTADMTTELESEELRHTIDVNKDKITDLQDTLLHDYKVGANNIRKISHSAKKRIFSQLDRMNSSRQRRSEGVGNIVDAEERCHDISLNWDVMPGSVVSERKKKRYKDESNNAPNITSAPKPKKTRRHRPYTGSANRRR